MGQAHTKNSVIQSLTSITQSVVTNISNTTNVETTKVTNIANGIKMNVTGGRVFCLFGLSLNSELKLKDRTSSKIISISTINLTNKLTAAITNEFKTLQKTTDNSYWDAPFTTDTQNSTTQVYNDVITSVATNITNTMMANTNAFTKTDNTVDIEWINADITGAMCNFTASSDVDISLLLAVNNGVNATLSNTLAAAVLNRVTHSQTSTNMCGELSASIGAAIGLGITIFIIIMAVGVLGGGAYMIYSLTKTDPMQKMMKLQMMEQMIQSSSNRAPALGLPNAGGGASGGDIPSNLLMQS
jgi:hypothetical protein